MPELSRFFGIIIRMYRELGAPHNEPHFHAYYHEHMAVFTIEPVQVIAGTFPLRQRRLVETWAELHQAELRRDWNLLLDGNRPLSIAPLH
jgi:hypothetical protein